MERRGETLVYEMKILGNVCLQKCVIKYNKQSNCHTALWVTGSARGCVSVGVGGVHLGLN